MGIVWSDGYAQKRYKNVSAPKVYQEIVSIGDSATPEQIVEAAKDEKSELHKCFTWDDTEAANNWRKQEARLIRHFLKIESETDPDAPKIAALHFTGVGEGYKAAPLVFRNPTEYSGLLKRAYAELHAFAEKYRVLSNELDAILKLIDELP